MLIDAKNDKWGLTYLEVFELENQRNSQPLLLSLNLSTSLKNTSFEPGRFDTEYHCLNRD
ncbi:hypothetical protein Ga0451573_003456 [Peptococcaceae bacterium DYL19]|nr:hypothetical protein [Phosphitispora fastidiosa]